MYAQAWFLNIMTPISGYESLWLWFVHWLVTFHLSWVTFHSIHRFSQKTYFPLEQVLCFIHWYFCVMMFCATGQQWAWRVWIIFSLLFITDTWTSSQNRLLPELLGIAGKNSEVNYNELRLIMSILKERYW